MDSVHAWPVPLDASAELQPGVDSVHAWPFTKEPCVVKAEPASKTVKWATQEQSAGNNNGGDDAATAAMEPLASFKGTIQRFIPKLGFGFITPDDAASFPQDVKLALAKQIRDAKACKVPTVGDAIYFSAEDVTFDEGVGLTAGAQVSFEVRADNKGPSAFRVSTGFTGV